MEDMFVLYGIIGFGLIALCGFFKTKKEGFGRFNTATLLLLLVLIISSLLVLNNTLDEKIIVNIIFSVIGFSGGLFVKEGVNND